VLRGTNATVSSKRERERERERERGGEKDGEINFSSLIRLLGALIRPSQSLLPALLAAFMDSRLEMKKNCGMNRYLAVMRAATSNRSKSLRKCTVYFYEYNKILYFIPGTLSCITGNALRNGIGNEGIRDIRGIQDNGPESGDEEREREREREIV